MQIVSARAPISFTSFSNSARARGIGALMPLGEDEFVLQRMFQAGQFGHPHLVAMGFQEQARAAHW